MTIITLDIETIPAQAAWVRDDIAAKIGPPGTLRKAESIAEWERESKPGAIESEWLKTSFDGGTGSVVAICWAVDDQPTNGLQVADWRWPEAERDMLAGFFAAIRELGGVNSGQRPVIVGHNVIGFDLPFLTKRAIVHGIRPPLWWPRNPKPWSDSVFDTMTQWAGDRDRISLDRLCRVLGLEGKGDGPTGADVWPMVQAGRIDDVVTYCHADVERTRAVYRKLVFA